MFFFEFSWIFLFGAFFGVFRFEFSHLFEMLELLPLEIRKLILNYVEREDLCRLSGVSKNYKEFARDSSLIPWKVTTLINSIVN